MKRQEPFNVLRDPNAWSSAPRAEAIVVAIAGEAFVATVAGKLAIAAVSLGLSVATNAIISALTPAPPTPKQSLLVNSRDAAAPQEFVYGEMRKGGPITYLETTRGGSVLYQIIPLAAHEIESVEAIYINDEVATLSADGYDNGNRTGAGWVTSPRKWSEDDDEGKHEIRIFYHLGDQTSITDTFANSSVESLDSVFFDTGATDEDSQNFGGVGQPTKASFVGNGIAYLFVRYGYAADVFRNGLPVITARIKGKKVFDPRTSTTAYSNNAALCIRDYLTSAYGLSDAQVDATVFSNAANVCDENVTLAAGGTEDRYTLNGVVRADQSYGDVLQQMVTSCAGTLFWGGGKWKLVVGAYNAPTKTLTLDDLRSNISLQTRVNLRDQFNKVQGVFNDANQRYIAADYPPIESAPFLAQDNGVEQALDLDLPFTTSAAMAQRLAKMTLFRGREQMVFQAEFGMNAFDVEVGEIVALTIDRYGWTAKEFEVVNWRFFIGSEGDMRIAMALRETSAAAFSWTAEESEIIGNDTNLVASLEPVENLTATFDGTVAADGTFLNGILVDWDSSVGASGYEIEWTVNNSIDYAANGGIVEEADAVTTRELFIYKGYIELLYRQPDQDGFDFYNTGGGSGLDEEAFRAQLAASPERASLKFAGVAVYSPTTEYVIKPVLDNVIYNIRVRATNSGVKSLWRSVTFTTIPDDTIPNAPANLVATGGQGAVNLTWDAVTTNTDASAANDIFLYAIYRGTSANPTTLVATTAGTGWSDVGLVNGTTYHYRVRAVDFTGNPSAYSANASATTTATGAIGSKTVSGVIYYQTLQGSSPGTPSATSFDRTTGAFTGLTSGWSLIQPSVEITDTAVQEWSSRFVATFEGGATTTTDITFTVPSGAIQVTTNLESDNFDGSISSDGTFASVGTQGWAITRDGGSAVFNDVSLRGDLGVGSTITNTTTLASPPITVGLKSNPGIASSNAAAETADALEVYRHAINYYCIDAINYNGPAIRAYSNLLSPTVYGTGDAIVAVNGGIGGSTCIDATSTRSDGATGPGLCQIALSGYDGGYGIYIPASSEAGGLDGSGNGFSPFTGTHMGMLLKTSLCEPGDILVDGAMIVSTISDSFTEVVKSTEASQAGAIGVLQKRKGSWIVPPAFIDRPATKAAQAAAPEGTKADNVLLVDPAQYHDDYDLVDINSVGEGAINLCGEGGDISKGDLIVTSSTPGKGMKQADDIVRSYTVAKAREDVTFSGPDDIKLVACIYLCG